MTKYVIKGSSGDLAVEEVFNTLEEAIEALSILMMGYSEEDFTIEALQVSGAV